MNPAERFGRLLGRLWPLWLPLLLALAWPLARPVVRAQVFGSPLLSSMGASNNRISLEEIWGELFWDNYEESPNPLPAATTLPTDLDLQVWERSWGHARNQAPTKSQTLVVRFPAEPVVYALALRELSPNLRAQTPDAPKAAAAELARLRQLALAAAALEPDNAYWWVQLAIERELSGANAAVLPLLERAARCSIYDNKDREIARRSLAAFDGRYALTWEEKRAILLSFQAYDSGQYARKWGQRARVLAQGNDVRGALRWGAALASVGGLMGGAKAATTSANIGRIWQREAWSVGAPGIATARNSGDWSEKFVLLAARNGQSELAAQTRALAVQARANDALINSMVARTDESWLDGDGLDATLRAVNIGGVVLMNALIYLGVWWMAGNLFLWRAIGPPSSRRARMTASGIVVAILLALAIVVGLWFWRDSLRSVAVARSPQHRANEIICFSLAFFAFVGAPWLLSLAVAGATLWRGRAQFTLPPRVDLELQLSRFSRRLLRWTLPLAVIGSALTLIIGWALMTLGFRFNWRNVDLLDWLPPDRNGNSGSLSWNLSDEPYILIYGIFLCVLCLLIWFAKWRFGTPQRLRPLTHGALRWWKESLGCAIAWLMWVCLLLILLSLPTRARAEARLGAVLQRGELAVMREIKG